MRRRRGFTIIELLVVVVILALLGVLAVNIYKRYVLKARTSEAMTMLAHIKARQEAYHAEHYRYAHIPTFFPASVPPLSSGDARSPAGDPPDEWKQLGVAFGGKILYYQYKVESDQGNVANAPPGGHAQYGLTPGQAWFVATAQVGTESSTIDTTYEIVSNRDSVWKVDKFGNRGP